MASKNRNRVYLTDRMVLIGLGIGAAYWIIECLLYVFLSYRINFFDRLIGPDLAGLSTRLIVICLFLIFGSHAQYTFNQRKSAERELAEMKAANEALKKELAQLKQQ